MTQDAATAASPGRRLDVLLVYPAWTREGGRGKLQRMLPPLGPLSLAACLEQSGFSVAVADIHAERLSPADFARRVTALQPRVVGITVLSPAVRSAHHVARLCRERVPDARIYAGGVHAEALADQMLADSCLDGVVRGDGEDAIVELARGVGHPQVLGLSHRVDGRVVHNEARPPELNLDRHPFPAFHLVDLARYRPAAGSYRQLPAVGLVMTRGCPGDCNFCNSAGTPLRARAPERVVELIERLHRLHGVRQVNFYDDTFTARPKAVRRFCELMIERKLPVSWLCYVRGDFLSEENARLMAQAGCHQVLVGVEAGDETLLEGTGKRIAKDRYRRTVELAHRAGMEVRTSFIIGHLEETRRSLAETAHFARELDVDYLQLSVLTPYPGTRLHRDARAAGLLAHEEYEHYGQNEVVLKLRHLTAADILAWERRTLLSFYLRPRSLWRNLRRLRHLSHLTDLAHAFFVIAGSGLSGVTRAPTPVADWGRGEGPSSLADGPVLLTPDAYGEQPARARA